MPDINSPQFITYYWLYEELRFETKDDWVIVFPFITLIRKVLLPSAFVVLSFSPPIQFGSFTVLAVIYFMKVAKSFPYKSNLVNYKELIVNMTIAIAATVSSMHNLVYSVLSNYNKY